VQRTGERGVPQPPAPSTSDVSGRDWAAQPNLQMVARGRTASVGGLAPRDWTSDLAVNRHCARRTQPPASRHTANNSKMSSKTWVSLSTILSPNPETRGELEELIDRISHRLTNPLSDSSSPRTSPSSPTAPSPWGG
jgi:hypothetical protein